MIDNKLVTLVKLIECQSYTMAAKVLNQTQPSVTWSIKKLQEEYNIEIFDKSIGTFALTHQGKMLYEYAKLVINNEFKFIETLRVDSKLRVGATLSIADYYIPTKAINYSLIESFVVNNTSTLIKKIFDGEIDCAFIEGNFNHNELQSIKFNSAKFICVARSDHKLVDINNKFGDIFDYPILIREEGSGTRNIIESYLKLKNYDIQSFKDIYSSNNFNIIKQSLLECDAISFMYENVCCEEIKNNSLSMIKINDFELTHNLYFVYLQNNVLSNEINDYYKSF